MLPTEQDEFLETVTHALALYDKAATDQQLMRWWVACKRLSLVDVKRALDAHVHGDDGRFAPKPANILRVVKGEPQGNGSCAAVDVSGRCAYPGIFSSGTMGDGPWWCVWHRMDSVGEQASAVIRQSHEVPYEDALALRIERSRSTEASR